MWFLVHASKKTKAVAGGETFRQTCPSCNRMATFCEVEITESVGVFFVDVLGDRERAFKCGACGDVFDAKDEAPPAPARSAAELAREARALEARRAAEAKAREEAATAKANRIEDELAELKLRLGR